MLKFTYTETGFYMERLAQSLEEWVTARVILALRVGYNICVEPSSAAFLLRADLPGLSHLESQASRDGLDSVVVSVCDHEYVEISLCGTWIGPNSESAEGIFVTTMSDRTEFFILKLWQESQNASCLKEAGD